GSAVGVVVRPVPLPPPQPAPPSASARQVSAIDEARRLAGVEGRRDRGREGEGRMEGWLGVET
ncbi:MAG: hypothetical protein KC593_03820, partial [Myxococcales bacterium]|nr:hypothetical protein [Myxococcales bacterium]